MYSNDEIIEKLTELGKLAEWDKLPESIVKKLRINERYGIGVSLEYDLDKGLEFVFSIPNCNDSYDFDSMSIENVFALTSEKKECF